MDRKEELNIGLNLTRNNFTMVSNKMLTDNRISFGAKGLLALMLSRPSNWQFFKNELVKNSCDTEYALTKLLKELTVSGYLFRFKIANKGKGAGFKWIWIFKDEKLTDEEIKKVENFYKPSKIDVSNDTVNLTTSLNNDDSCLALYTKTNLLNNTNLNTNKNHEHDSIDIFDNLFKEFGINYTKTNQASVKRLLKTMKEQEVITYLKETYKALSENKDIKNLAGAFSKKIAEGTRQVNPKPEKEIETPVPVEVKAKKVEVVVQEEIESDQKDLQVVIGKITLALIKKKRMNLNVKLGAIKTLEEAEKFIIENNIEL
ncbi:hypothetical protein [Cetobacterium sp.]|uniref:hypothetical protein n=1 Tax=Cetobacterium sp. TaxID=2071632 RepID=UPI003F2D7387